MKQLQNLKRYHRDVFFPGEDTELLFKAVKSLNEKRWRKSKHFVTNLERSRKLYKLIKQVLGSLWLDSKDIFEYYKSDNKILKMCFRIENVIEGKDLILVVTTGKLIVTFYLNDTHDTHKDLDISVYEKE